jgi:hypothetical protein
MSNEEDKALILRLVHHTLPVSKVSMIGNPGLIMFYLVSFLADHIYYIRELDLAAVVEFEDEIMYLQDVFCEKEFDLDEVIYTLKNEDGKKAVLGFTPSDTASFSCEILKEEGTTFFVKGNNPLEKGRFPILSHA